jgi:MerR family copper efflux transcriptional regulator
MSQFRRHLAILPNESGKIPQEDLPKVLQVGELAKRTGKTVRAIHLYEDLGLLNPVERSPGRYRLYNSDSVERVRWIVKLQAVGFSLPDLKALLSEQGRARTGKEAAMVLRGAYVGKLTMVQVKLAELHRLEQELLSSLTYLDACQTACEAEVQPNSCPECSRHVDQPAAPSLVTGAHIH